MSAKANYRKMNYGDKSLKNTSNFHFKVSGDYNKVFSFQTVQERNNFAKSKDFKALKKKYTINDVEFFENNSYNIGEEVNVMGDGENIYKVEKISNDGSYVVLNTGFRESSYKLHKNFINAGMV